MDMIKIGTALKIGYFGGYERCSALLLKNEAIIYSDNIPGTIDELMKLFRECSTTADSMIIKSFIEQ